MELARTLLGAYKNGIEREEINSEIMLYEV